MAKENDINDILKSKRTFKVSCLNLFK